MVLPRAEQCAVCRQELVRIAMSVDGRDLVMVSCQKCDTRRWTHGGVPIDLQHALDEVGEHTPRRKTPVSSVPQDAAS